MQIIESGSFCYDLSMNKVILKHLDLYGQGS